MYAIICGRGGLRLRGPYLTPKYKSGTSRILGEVAMNARQLSIWQILSIKMYASATSPKKLRLLNVEILVEVQISDIHQIHQVSKMTGVLAVDIRSVWG